MSSTKKAAKKRAGRRKIVDAPASITITIDASDVALAEQLADTIKARTFVKTTHLDVMRAALTKGLEFMRAELSKR